MSRQCSLELGSARAGQRGADDVARVELDDGAYLELYEGFLSSAESGALFQALLAEVPFAERTIRVYGREVMQPRLVAWVGEPEAVYVYSGT